MKAIVSFLLLPLAAIVIVSCSKYQEASSNRAVPLLSSSTDITDSVESQFISIDFELIELDIIKQDLLKNRIKSKYFERDFLTNINLIDTSFNEFILKIIPEFMGELKLDDTARNEFIKDSDQTWKSYFDLRGEVISMSCSEVLEVFKNPSCKKILLSAIGSGYDLKHLTINHVIKNGRLAYMNVSGPSWTFNYIIEVHDRKIYLVQLGGITFG